MRAIFFYGRVDSLQAPVITTEVFQIMKNGWDQPDFSVRLVGNKIRAINFLYRTTEAIQKIIRDFSPVAFPDKDLLNLVSCAGQDVVETYRLGHMPAAFTLNKENKFFRIIHLMKRKEGRESGKGVIR